MGDGSDGCTPERPTLRFVRAPSVVEHAIRALVVLAQAPPGRLLKIREICAPGDLSRKFVAAALNDLRPTGLVESRRGSHGGYQLAVPPDEITIAQVFEAVDIRTPTQVPGTGDTIDLWVEAEREVRSRFLAITIGDLVSAGAT